MVSHCDTHSLANRDSMGACGLSMATTMDLPGTSGDTTSSGRISSPASFLRVSPILSRMRWGPDLRPLAWHSSMLSLPALRNRQKGAVDLKSEKSSGWIREKNSGEG